MTSQIMSKSKCFRRYVISASCLGVMLVDSLECMCEGHDGVTDELQLGLELRVGSGFISGAVLRVPLVVDG